MSPTDEELATRLRRTTAFGGLLHVAECPSTMDLAARDPDGGPMVFWADHQTGGRGRRQRPWHDEPGADLAVTFRVRANLPNPVALPAVVPLCALEAIAAVASELTPRLRLKWPNDVLLGDRKVAGILIDASTARRDTYLVGVGINVNSQEPPAELATIATSLRRDLGRACDRHALLLELAERLDAALAQLARGEHAAFEARYRERLGLMGRQVTVHVGTPASGRLVGLDFHGIALADGRTFPLGQVQSLRAD